jgi:hypothetical protein
MAAPKKEPEEVKDNVPFIPAAEKYVTIRVPRDRDDREDKVVWVNERRFIIQRGVPVEVPESVAAILEHEEKMLEYIYEYESKVQR